MKLSLSKLVPKFYSDRVNKIRYLLRMYNWVYISYHTYGECSQEFIDEVADKYNSTKFFWMKKL
jgi:hypothetical protein